jgi:hypothetical protein
MKVKRIAFFGHRKIDNVNAVERMVEEEFKKELSTSENLEILIGRDGDFDIIVASVANRLKRKGFETEIFLIWCMPYETSNYRNNIDNYNCYYDRIEMFDFGKVVHYKASHKNRNRRMVDLSDKVIFLVERNEGGAYPTMKYAIKQNKKIINLFDGSLNNTQK